MVVDWLVRRCLGAMEKNDDDSGLDETLLGVDIGGDVWALGDPAAVPPVPPPAPANAAQRRRRALRLRQLFSHL